MPNPYPTTLQLWWFISLNDFLLRWTANMLIDKVFTTLWNLVIFHNFRDFSTILMIIVDWKSLKLSHLILPLWLETIWQHICGHICKQTLLQSFHEYWTFLSHSIFITGIQLNVCLKLFWVIPWLSQVFNSMFETILSHSMIITSIQFNVWNFFLSHSMIITSIQFNVWHFL